MNHENWVNGNLFKVVNNIHDHGFSHGEIIRLVDAEDSRFEHVDGSDYWWLSDLEVEFAGDTDAQI